MKFIQHFIDNLTPGHFEGMFLYLCGAITVTWVHVHFRKDVVDGLKGENGKWEAPEWLVYLSSWIWPHMIMASGFLQVVFPIEAWLMAGALTLFGLTGRWGLEWLYSMRTGQRPPNQTPTP